MRVNEPITQNEREVPPGDPLVSRTDPGGRILFANRTFVALSGFTEQELVGAPHNLVRHPHMPAAAFADLWKTIKVGDPWDGLVKNRAKNGDFYWVRANVTPMVEDDEITGYISIRSQPTRAQVAVAEQTYSDMRAGRATHLTLHAGELVPGGWRAMLVNLARSVLGRIGLLAMATVLLVLLVGWLGFSGMAASNNVLRHVYESDLVAVSQLRGVLDRLRDSRNQIAQIVVALDRGTKPELALQGHESVVRVAMTKNAEGWRAYQSEELTAEQRQLAAKFAGAVDTLQRDVILPALDLAQRGETAQLDELFQKRAPALFQAAFDANRELVDMQISLGRQAYTQAVASLDRRLIIGGAATGLGLVLLLIMGWALHATIRRCVQDVQAHFKAIIHNDFEAPIPTPTVREFGHMTAMLRAMRAHLAFGRWERSEFERRASQIRRETVEKMALTIEQEAGAAVARVADRMAEMARDADSMAGSAERVSVNAEHVSGAADHAMQNAQVVASASEELAASIHEISAQVDHASTVARTAAEKGNQARETIRSLSEAAGQIGNVVRTIADIAGQTNLLALNATIEAARAGEAGKGFAVVASEVKTLASQTAKATEEISRQIAGLREATGLSVAAVEEIGHTLDEVARVAISLAAAVEQQTAATQEIARNVAESGAAVQEVTNRIAQVSTEAAATGRQAATLQSTSGIVAEDIATLRGVLVRTIRTATEDADRRLEVRTTIGELCTFVFDESREEGSGTLSDLSVNGAAIVPVSPCDAAVGHQGMLALNTRGGAHARFTIRSVSSSHDIHVEFDNASISEEFKQARDAMIARHRSVSQAA